MLTEPGEFLTGKYPSRHGVTLTMTEGDLFPDRANVPDVLRTVAHLAASGEVPRGRLADRFVRGTLRLGPKSGNEPELAAGTATLATLLRERGYHVAFKGKWHLTKPVDDHGWSARTRSGSSATTASPGGSRPMRAETPRPPRSAEATRAAPSEGWDEDYTRQVERWLGRAGLPEPFCLVVSLVNPHDVLGYPSSYVQGGYAEADFRGLGVPLPATIDEDLRDKPAVHSLMKLGQTAYIGELPDREAEQDYVNFYA